MKYLSTFTGIGGFELGIQNAFEACGEVESSIDTDGYLPDNPADAAQKRRQPATCIGYSEVDKYAIKTYEEHYEHTNYGDITAINESDLPDFDLIVGGFPCQAFSVAGKRKGFEEARGTLFFDVARIVAHKRPRHLVLENVKGLLTHDKGKTFEVILGILTDLGYDVEWHVLNSKDFGVPQNRERVYIVGHLGGGCGRKIFPLGESGAELGRASVEARSKRERVFNYPANTLAQRDYKGGNQLVQLNNPVHSNDRVYADTGISPTLNTMQGGRRQPFVASLTEARTEEAKAIRREYQKQGRDFNPRRGKNLVPRTDGITGTIPTTPSKEQLITDFTRIRRLTPTECERLQGFPDGWTIGSDTQRYKQCGNAVTTNVVEAVMTALLTKGCLS